MSGRNKIPGLQSGVFSILLSLLCGLLLFGGPASASGSFSITITIHSLGPTVSSLNLYDRRTGSIWYTNDRAVTVEAVGVSGTPAEMLLSAEAGFAGAAWVGFLNPTTYLLPGADGTKEVYYKVRDGALVESNTVEASIVLDTASPEAPALLSPADGSYTNEARPLFAWSPAVDTLSGVSNYEIRIDNVPATQDATTTYRPPAALAEGNHQWRVRAKDRAQNWGDFSLTRSLTVDVTAPTVGLLSPEAGELIAGLAGPYTVRWTAVDAYGLADDPIALYFSADSGASWSPIAAGLPNRGSYSWNLPAVTAATCRVRVTARDRAGNLGSAVSSGDFAVDSTTPEAALVTAATNVPLDSDIVIRFNKAMRTAGVAARFSITPEVSGTLAWSEGDTLLTFSHPDPFDYGADYEVRFAAGALDLAGNPLPATALPFRTIPRDSEPPEIKISTAGLALKNNDYVGSGTQFDLNFTDNVSLDAGTLLVRLDGADVVYFYSQLTDRKISVFFKPAGLAVGEHRLMASIADAAGNYATREVTGLQVYAGPADIRGLVVSPLPLAPARGQVGKIAYSLNKDVEIRIAMYGVSGEQVWTRRYAPGTNGGKAGYNEIEFNGRSDISRAPLANGIYVFRVLAEGKAIARGQMVIYE